MSHAAGTADTNTPISISDIIHELSSRVIGIGESSSSSFGIDGDPHALAVPATNSSKVAIKKKKKKKLFTSSTV